MTLTAYLVLLGAALFDLGAVMLVKDLPLIQLNEFDSRRMNAALKERGEFYSPARLLPLAVLIGACTTMARESWIVVMLLAAVLVAQGLVLLYKSFPLGVKPAKRAWRLYLTTLVITLVIVVLAGDLGSRKSPTDGAQTAALTATLLLAASPLLVMLVNWLLTPIERRISP